MAKKLSEDQIKWILSLDVTEAEEGCHKLSQENKKLEERNKEVKKSLRDLEKAGKSESDAFKKLSEELNGNNQKLASNREMIKRLSLQMGLTNMTMAQLKRHAQDLQKQLDNTSEALHPEEYAKLNQQLLATKERMNELKGSGKNIEADFGKVIKSQGTIAAFLGNVYAKVAGWGIQMVAKGKEFLAESIKMAASADGVQRAFDALDQPKLLKHLQEATKGTVNNLELMKAAVKAKDFRIPLEDLGKYLQFAQLKAQQTGQSVEYMTDSIVTGLGRKSLLILDNLGLSAAEINEEVAKTGDFMKGVASIVDKQLVAAGGKYISAADKIQQKSVLIQNIQLAIGQRMQSLANGWESAWIKVLKVVDKFVSIPVEDKIRVERQEVNLLATAVMAANDRTDVRQRLIRELNEKYPKFLQNLDMEKLTNEQLVNRLREVNQEYSNKIRIQVMNDKVLAPMQEREQKLAEEQIELYKGMSWAVQNLGQYMSRSFMDAIKNGTVVNMTTQEINAELQKMEKNGASKSLTRYSSGLESKINRLKEIPGELKKVQSETEKIISAISDMQVGVEDDSITPEVTSGKDLIEEKKKEIELAEASVATTEAEIIAKNKKVKVLKDELETLQNLGVEKDKNENNAVKDQLAEQDHLYAVAQLKLKQRYLFGNDEELQSRSQFNHAMEDMLIQDLNARLKIMGLEPEQRQKIEQQLLDIRIKALEDFRAKKVEIEEQERGQRQAANQKAIQDNNTWMAGRMKKLQEDHKQQVEVIHESLQQQVEQYKGYGSQMGEALGSVLSGQENMLAAFGNTMVDILFDVLSQIINQKIAEATAVAIAEQAKAAAISAAQPDSVATFGATAAARTAIIGGLIMAGLSAAKTTLKGLLSKGRSTSSISETSGNTTYNRVAVGRQSGGKIDITRAQDGKFFPGADYDPDKRGFVDKPTVIVGEGPVGQSKEWIASNDTVDNPTIAPLLNVLDQAQQAGTIRTLDLNKVIQARMAGFASGGSIAPKSAISTSQLPVSGDNKMGDALSRFCDVMERLEETGLPAYTLLDEYDKARVLQQRSRKIGSKS
ncbi:hypothetical protein [Phocaeicola sp.]